MFTVLDILLPLDTRALPAHVGNFVRLCFLGQLWLLPLALRSQGPSLRASPVPFWNPLFHRNLEFVPFIAIWTSFATVFFASTTAAVFFAKHARRTSSLRTVWLCIKVALLALCEAGYPTILCMFFAPLSCSKGSLSSLSDSTRCWTERTTPLFVISLIAFVGLTLCACLLALTLFDAFPLSGGRLAKSHGRIDAATMLWVAAIVVFVQLVDSGSATPFWWLMAALSALTAIAYSWFQPFFASFGNQAHSAAFMGLSWICIALAVEQQRQLNSGLAAGLFCASVGWVAAGWVMGGLRVSRRPIMLLDSENQHWHAQYPKGLHVWRRRSSVPYGVDESGPFSSRDIMTTALVTGTDLPASDSQTRVSGSSVRYVYMASDVELATRFLITTVAQDAYSQGRANLTPNRWARTIAAVADQYYQRGQRKFPRSSLIKLHYARFLAWWMNAYDAANTMLLELSHDPSTPLDVRFLALKEQALLRGAADDSVTTSLLTKAKEEHGKSLNALLAFLKESALRRQQGGRADISTLSHLAHIIGTRRQSALEYYREGLGRRQRPDRGALVYWAMFLDSMMLDHTSASRTREYIERLESQSVSQRTTITASSSSSGSSTEIPGLSYVSGSGESSDGANSLGVAKLLQRNIKLAMAFLGILTITVVVYNYQTTSTVSAAVDRLVTVSKLRSLAYQVMVMAADYLRSGVAGVPDQQYLPRLVDMAELISDTHGAFIDNQYRSDIRELKLSHSETLTPIRTTSNGQQTLRMAAVWEFGDLLGSTVMNLVKQNRTNASALDSAAAYTFLSRNIQAIGSAYNRSAWLYGDRIPLQGRESLIGECILLLCGVLVLSVTVLLFLWSFTRIAQQRLVVLRFFSALPGDVLTEMISDTEMQITQYKRPPNYSQTATHSDGEGELTEEDEHLPGKTLEIPVPKESMLGTKLPIRKVSTEADIEEIELTRGPPSSASSGRLFWPANSNAPTDAASATAAPKDTVSAPAAQVPVPTPPPLRVRVLSPEGSETGTPRKSVNRISSAPNLKHTKDRKVGGAKQAPILVFLLLGLLFVLVIAAIVVLVSSLVDLGQLERDAENGMAAYVSASRTWIRHYVKTRQARKFSFFGQLRRYTQYWDQDLDSANAVSDLGRYLASESLLESIYNAYYICAANVKNQECTAMGLAAMCFDIPSYQVTEIASYRWSSDPNSTVTDPLTLQQTLTHYDYATDKMSPKSVQCKAARAVLFTESFKTTLETCGSGMQAAVQAALADMDSSLLKNQSVALQRTFIILSVYIVVIAVLLILAAELQHRHKMLWNSFVVRSLLVCSVIGGVIAVSTLVGSAVVLKNEVNAIRTRNRVTQYALLQERVVDQLGSYSFQFAAQPNIDRYNQYWQVYNDFEIQWADLSFLPGDLWAASQNVKTMHQDLMLLDYISMVLVGTAKGWLNKMPEVSEIDWDGSRVPNSRFTTRANDTTLPAQRLITLAQEILSDDVETTRRSAITTALTEMQILSDTSMTNTVNNASQVRLTISWVVLGVSGALGAVSLTLGLVLAVKALDLSGSQALTKLNDTTLNMHVRRHRLALALIAVLFVLMLGVLTGEGIPLSEAAPQVVWSMEHEATTAQCTLHASSIVTASNNASFTQNQREMQDCMDRMIMAREKLFSVHGGTVKGDLRTAYTGSSNTIRNASGLYYFYTGYITAGRDLTSAATNSDIDTLALFAQVRAVFGSLLPLFDRSQQALLQTLTDLHRRAVALQFTLSAVLVLVLFLEYLFFFRPMLAQLLEDQAIMRTLLSLIPEGALTAEMEEYLEKGAVGNSELLLEDNDDQLEDRVEADSDELKFMTAQLEELAKKTFPALVCSTEGTILWSNTAASRLQPEIVGSHVSTFVPWHTHLCLGPEVERRLVALCNGDAVELHTEALAHPRTGALYHSCEFSMHKDEPAFQALKRQLAQGSSLQEACVALDACATAAAVCDPSACVVYASAKVEKLTGRMANQLTGFEVRAILANPASLPPHTGSLLACGCDVMVKSEGRPTCVPWFVHVRPLVVSGEKDPFFALFFYPISTTPSAAVTLQPPAAQPSHNRQVKHPKHTEFQQKRCTVLHLEISQPAGSSANSTVTSARSAKLLHAIFELVSKHNGYLHWILGDQVIVTFNHSSANGSHALSACSVASGLANNENMPDKASFRIAITSSVAYCGYYGRLPLLQGDCLSAAALLLRVQKEVPCQCAIDSSVWQAAQYSYHTRLVNEVKPTNGAAVPVYELGQIKQHALDEWMYQLANESNPYSLYDSAVRQLKRGEASEAESLLAQHLEKYTDDRVAVWLKAAMQNQDEPRRLDWCGTTCFSLEWFAPI
eukprot:TRINITY_DN2762_c0_g1_i4.p1 TRINITY_DN2762_c0_g1~~TRINITY_DN2762_c0_g1_i4.p1  ORF type:complete len:2330 (-),score=273.92 TRINITY_DN2762_c0_g1_i4:71-7060(-)